MLKRILICSKFFINEKNIYLDNLGNAKVFSNFQGYLGDSQHFLQDIGGQNLVLRTSKLRCRT